MNNSISVIIPAYNEREGIKDVLDEIVGVFSSGEYSYEIIVVDDCSTDGTYDILSGYIKNSNNNNIKIIRHAVNKGYGASIMTGISVSQNDCIVTIDGDGSYSAFDIRPLMPFQEEFDLIVGLRTGKEYRGSWLKYIARIFFRLLAEYISGEKIPDINSGLRIFSKKTFKSMPSVHICRGFSFSTTMTLMYMASGLSVKFEPIRYRTRKGKTKVRYFRDVLRALQILLEIGIYYNPIKVILPFVFVPFIPGLVSLGAAIFDKVEHRALWLASSFVNFSLSCLIFTIGMLLTQLRMTDANRQNN